LSDGDELAFTQENNDTNQYQKSMLAKLIINPVIRDTFSGGKPNFFQQNKQIDQIDQFSQQF
jgi:hypothetical protein